MEKFTASLEEISSSVENLIKDGAKVPIYVSGSSMNPFLVSRRDIVWVRACNLDDLKKGRIILFKRQDGRPVLHRIKSVLSDEVLKVNGDAQNWCELVKKESVVAVATEIERKGKRKSADSFSCKLMNVIWQLLFPCRPLIMRVWFKIRRIKKGKMKSE